jgi:hypothetical protein
MAVVPLLEETRWGAFSGFVPEIPVVPADVVSRRRVAGVLRLTPNCNRWRSLDCERLCVCDALADASYRESSSIRSRIPDVLSVAAGEMFSFEGWGVNSQILSAR